MSQIVCICKAAFYISVSYFRHTTSLSSGRMKTTSTLLEQFRLKLLILTSQALSSILWSYDDSLGKHFVLHFYRLCVYDQSSFRTIIYERRGTQLLKKVFKLLYWVVMKKYTIHRHDYFLHDLYTVIEKKDIHAFLRSS